MAIYPPDPVGSGLVASIAWPGGNTTVFTNFEPSLTGKWLELLNDMDIASNMIRTVCGGFLLTLTGAVCDAQVGLDFPSTARRLCARSPIPKVAIVSWNSDCKVTATTIGRDGRCF